MPRQKRASSEVLLKGVDRYLIPDRRSAVVWRHGAWWLDHRQLKLAAINQSKLTRLHTVTPLRTNAALSAAFEAGDDLLSELSRELRAHQEGASGAGDRLSLVDGYHEWVDARHLADTERAEGATARQQRNIARASVTLIKHAGEALVYLRKQGRVTARVVSSQDTLAYAKVLAKKYKSENSQRSRWKALQAWFSWMIAEKGVQTVGNIFPRGKGPKVTPRVRKDKDTFPVLRDVAATLDALTYLAQLDRRYLPAYIRMHLIAYTGCRLAETAHMRWDGLRLGGEVPSITIIETKRKGHATRVVPLWPRLEAALGYYARRLTLEGAEVPTHGLILRPRVQDISDPAARAAMLERARERKWLTTADRIAALERGHIKAAGSYAPYRALKRAARNGGFVVAGPQHMRAIATTMLEKVLQPGTQQPYPAETVGQLLGHSLRVRGAHYLRNDIDPMKPRTTLDYHGWADVPYWEPGALTKERFRESYHAEPPEVESPKGKKKPRKKKAAKKAAK
ncbi:MAG: site-specific integrase [Gemmatimonadetes bacterium]|nr:site-specific integrase [Gemmatimonadota bacterium]